MKIFNPFAQDVSKGVRATIIKDVTCTARVYRADTKTWEEFEIKDRAVVWDKLLDMLKSGWNDVRNKPRK